MDISPWYGQIPLPQGWARRSEGNSELTRRHFKPPTDPIIHDPVANSSRAAQAVDRTIQSICERRRQNKERWFNSQPNQTIKSDQPYLWNKRFKLNQNANQNFSGQRSRVQRLIDEFLYKAKKRGLYDRSSVRQGSISGTNMAPSQLNVNHDNVQMTYLNNETKSASDLDKQPYDFGDQSTDIPTSWRMSPSPIFLPNYAHSRSSTPDLLDFDQSSTYSPKHNPKSQTTSILTHQFHGMSWSQSMEQDERHTWPMDNDGSVPYRHSRMRFDSPPGHLLRRQMNQGRTYNIDNFPQNQWPDEHHVNTKTSECQKMLSTQLSRTRNFKTDLDQMIRGEHEYRIRPSMERKPGQYSQNYCKTNAFDQFHHQTYQNLSQSSGFDIFEPDFRYPINSQTSSKFNYMEPNRPENWMEEPEYRKPPHTWDEPYPHFERFCYSQSSVDRPYSRPMNYYPEVDKSSEYHCKCCRFNSTSSKWFRISEPSDLRSDTDTNNKKDSKTYQPMCPTFNTPTLLNDNSLNSRKITSSMPKSTIAKTDNPSKASQSSFEESNKSNRSCSHSTQQNYKLLEQTCSKLPPSPIVPPRNEYAPTERSEKSRHEQEKEALRQYFDNSADFNNPTNRKSIDICERKDGSISSPISTNSSDQSETIACQYPDSNEAQVSTPVVSKTVSSNQLTNHLSFTLSPFIASSALATSTPMVKHTEAKSTQEDDDHGDRNTKKPAVDLQISTKAKNLGHTPRYYFSQKRLILESKKGILEKADELDVEE